MATVVAIDVPAELSPAVTQGAVTGCRNALGSGRCVDPRALYGVPDWYATVRSDGDQPGRLRIEFRKRDPSGELVAERVLSFSDRDPDASRWVSAGLVVAGLVAAEDATQRPVALVPLSGSELAPPPAAPPARRALLWGVDAGVLGGPALQQGPYRLGGFGRGWVGSRISGVLGALTLRYAARGGSPELTWWSVSGGLGARLGSWQSVITADVLGELVVERMAASATDPTNGREDRGGQARFGGRLGSNVAVRFAPGFRFLVGVDATALTPAVDLELKGSTVGREPSMRFSVTGGFRADF